MQGKTGAIARRFAFHDLRAKCASDKKTFEEATALLRRPVHASNASALFSLCRHFYWRLSPALSTRLADMRFPVDACSLALGASVAPLRLA
jgi:hypothetical protein